MRRRWAAFPPCAAVPAPPAHGRGWPANPALTTRRVEFRDERGMEIFDYDNVLLLPRKCRVESRSECDPSVEFGPRRFALPVVPANMKTVVDEPIVEMLATNGFFYVMHRFDVDNVAFARRMR